MSGEKSAVSLAKELSVKPITTYYEKEVHIISDALLEAVEALERIIEATCWDPKKLEPKRDRIFNRSTHIYEISVKILSKLKGKK